MIEPNDDKARLNEYVQNKKCSKFYFAFALQKQKKQINTSTQWFYPWKKNIVLFIYFCIENAKIVLCKSILIYMSSVTHMGHIDWYDKYNFVL